MFGSYIDGLSEIEEWIENVLSAVGSVFDGVDFSDLFQSILPSDISNVLSSVLLVMIFLALVGLIRKILIFLG